MQKSSFDEAQISVCLLFGVFLRGVLRHAQTFCPAHLTEKKLVGRFMVRFAGGGSSAST